MRLGGTDVSNDVVKNIAGGALAVTLVFALFTRLVVGIFYMHRTEHLTQNDLFQCIHGYFGIDILLFRGCPLLLYT